MTTPNKRPVKFSVTLPAKVARDFKDLASSLGITSPEKAMREAIRCFFTNYGRADLAITNEAGPLDERPIGDLLASWRERHGLSQADASGILGVNRRSLQGWEGGRSTTQAMQRIILGLMTAYSQKHPA
jgi:DNA-binding transcriptional regulator YiaG